MQGMWGGDGGEICGGSHDDSAWASGRGVIELENFSHRERATDISNDLPGQWRPAEITSGRMPRQSGNKEGGVGPLPLPACPGDRGNSGRGKPPPLTVHPIRHDVPPAGTEWQALFHRSVRQGIGAKEAADSEGGSEGEIGEGL